MLKRKSLAILSLVGLAFSSSALYAGTLLPMENNNLKVTMPDTHPGFKFSIAALALKPGANNLNYVIYNKELPVQTPTWTEEELKPSNAFAFELGAGYNFAEGKDVNLDWTHLDTSTSATTVAPNFNYFLGPDYQIGPDGLPIRSSTGHVKFRYDVINLDVGQFVDFGRHLEMRFLGGISTAFLREQVTSTYAGNILAGQYQGPFSMQQQVTANFTGAGPRIGLNANYILDNGFGFMGEGAFSALIGSSYSKTNFTGSSQQLLVLYGQTINRQFIRDQNVSQVIPGLDAKLGVTYKHSFNKDTLLTVSAGYQGAVYFNAISQYLPGTLVSGQSLTTGGIFVATMNHTLSNYSVQGPFLKASLQLS
ncbi:MAG: Lpg1974 family pore-forming outer membrane protein [Gammaproteobacteria bacterium]|nr:Lpg1974 family pore-forming outer membrane protein [Gammaproteobacteria bacterium]